MPLIVQRRVILNSLVVQHDQRLHDLLARFFLEDGLVLADSFEQGVYLQLFHRFLCYFGFEDLPLFFVVLVHDEAEFFQIFADKVDAFVRVLHDDVEDPRVAMVDFAPLEGEVVRIVEVASQLLQRGQRRPGDEPRNVLHFVVRFKYQES